MSATTRRGCERGARDGAVGFSPGVLAVFVIAGCAHVTPAGQGDRLRRAEKLGRAIYEQDSISAAATDAAIDSGVLIEGRRPVGWITVPRDGGWVVDFIAEHNGQFVIAVEVLFAPRGDGSMVVTPRVVADEPLTGEARSMFLAQQAALARARLACSAETNTVVMPASLAGKEGWLVYVLPATKERYVQPLSVTRHRVSADGTQLLESEDLTRTCLTVRYESNAEALLVTHVVSNEPMEHHVWASLSAKRPVYVGTPDKAIWRVDERGITLLKRRQGGGL